MLQTLLFSVLIIAFCVLMLSVKIFFRKPFVNSHVSGNKAMREKGIHCAQAQDQEDRCKHLIIKE